MNMISWFFNDVLDFLFDFDQKPKRVALKIVENERKPGYRISDSFSLDPGMFSSDGERIAFIASSRQGKSYLTGKLIEEMLAMGRLLVITDPQGEYWTLQEFFPNVIIYGGKQREGENRLPVDADGNPLPITVAGCVQAVEIALKTRTSIVFDLSALKTNEEKCEFFSAYAEAMYYMQETSPAKQRVMSVIEEVAIFCPQKAKGWTQRSAEIILQFFTMGAKNGIDSMVATQRLQMVDKTIFSQCSIMFFGKVISPQDIKAFIQYLLQYGLKETDVLNLEKYRFFCCFHNKYTEIKSGKRKCKDGGETPVEILMTSDSATDFYSAIQNGGVL